jgi:hypothetical protein
MVEFTAAADCDAAALMTGIVARLLSVYPIRDDPVALTRSEEVAGHRYITQTKHPPLPIASRHDETEKIVR